MMTDLSELKKLLKLCRAQGVTEIEFDSVKIKLGEMPASPSTEIDDDKYAAFPEGELTPEQLMYYSAGGLPEDDPFRVVKA